MKLSNCQEQALNTVLKFLLDPDSTELAIEGRPGVGKTTLIQHIITAARKQSKFMAMLKGKGNEISIELTATTNQAANRLAEATGENACTIHSLLGLRVVNNFQNGTTSLKRQSNHRILHNTLVIIDEGYASDEQLHREVRLATPNCKVLYIGDPDQLLAVNETKSAVKHNVKDSFELKEIMRQNTLPDGSINPIALLGEAFRDTIHTGVFKPIIYDGVHISHMKGADFQQAINTAAFNKEDFKILAWTNNQVTAYNQYVRSLFTNDPLFQVGETLVTAKPILDGKSTLYSTDATCKITKVFSEVIMREGIPSHKYRLDGIVDVYVPQEKWTLDRRIKQLKAERDWYNKFRLENEFVDLRPLYASTVHKAQGSTTDTVFIDLGDIGKCNRWEDVARMLRVAVTRATTRVVCYDQLPEKYMTGVHTLNNSYSDIKW